MRVSNSVVVITGAGSGIGRATAVRFAEKGALLVLAGRRESALEATAAECAYAGSSVLTVSTDTSDPEAVEALAAAAVERFGRIDVWVNAAAVAFYSPFLTVPLADFRRVLDVGVMGYVYGCRAALARMTEQGSGTIINVASIVGVIAQPYTSAYSMAKAAVRALGVSLRSELKLAGERDIRVCTVLPPAIDTPFFDNAANYTGRRVLAMPPVYSAQRVARTIVRLASSPRAEKTVGAMGAGMVLQHRVAPQTLEAFMAVQVENTHLSRTEGEPATAGNLYRPSASPPAGSVAAGWHGRRKTAVRMAVAGGAAAAAAATVAARRRN